MKLGKPLLSESQIKSALEVCGNGYNKHCGACCLRGVEFCTGHLATAALDLINRQKVENERLVLIIDEIEYDHHRWVQEASIIRGEAINETVETVKKNSCCSSIFVNGEEKESSRIYQISEAELDELVKEKVGDTE